MADGFFVDNNDEVLVDKHIICNQPNERSTMDRAQEIKDNLPPNSPSFLKYLLRSHVTLGFWLGLPKNFCDEHMPEHDETIILVVENEEIEHKASYLADKRGLSAGWRGFSISQKLAEGDVCVFQLIEPFKFKVHIVRENALTEEDYDASSLPEVNADPMETSITSHGPTSLSESPLDFKDVETFDHFMIQVNGLILDSEMPTHLKRKYYQLCCSQKRFLHENLMKDLYGKIASGMISEMISISDAIQAATLSTGLADLERYDQILKAFEDLGMVVGFLRARIYKLLSLPRELEEEIEIMKNKRNEALDLTRGLEMRLVAIKRLVMKFNDDIDGLMNNSSKEDLFTQMACEPW